MTWEVLYVDWKGNTQKVYIIANSKAEALESAKVIQGLADLVSVEMEE